MKYRGEEIIETAVLFFITTYTPRYFAGQVYYA